MSAPFDPTPASDLPGVMARFDAILAWSRQSSSRLGYFAALYRGVTVGARTALADGAFERPDAAERLAVLFAGRYFEALAAHLERRATMRCWQVSFDAAGQWAPIVLQHLLLGINAHINLDLGIAAARTREELELPRRDFDRVNDLLLDMMDDVQDRLAAVWPLLRLLDRMAGRLDERLAGFGLRKARAEAWTFGQALLTAGADGSALIDAKDRQVADIARHVLHPGALTRAGLFTVRLGEPRSVVRIIDLLAAQTVQAAKAAGLARPHEATSP